MKYSGKVYTTKGEPIPFAHVVYIRPDGSSTSNGTQTNEFGHWELDIPNNGSVQFSSIQHVKRTIPLQSLPFIVTLDPITYTIPTAEVVAEKPKLNNKWLIYTALAAVGLIWIKKKA